MYSMMDMSTSSCCPATEALERSLKSPIANTNNASKMISSKSFKRSLNDMASFDMGSLLEASLPVEESISFPTIEWSNDIDSDDESLSSPPSAKRRCRGLVRSNGVGSELASLGSLSRLDSESSLC